MSWTGERLETYIFSRDAIEHLHRYSLISEYVVGKRVLDIACGEGYGSNIISKTAIEVFGVDIDEDSIEKAKIKYKNDNLTFKLGKADAIPLDDNSVDVVVSFETIEHHDKHTEMLSEIKRVLKSDGIIIISTPDKLYYSDNRNFKNKFHIKELYKEEFVSLMKNHFSKIQLLTQEFINGNSLIQEDASIGKIQIFSGNYNEIHQQTLTPLYLIIIASEVDFQRQGVSFFDGNQFVKAEVDSKIQNVYLSRTYKLGNFILKPFKFLKQMLK